MPAAATTTPEPPKLVKNLVQAVRSDDLPKIAATLRQVSVFKDCVEVFQVDLILDANVVIRDLLWLARKRTKPDARTEVMELMDCEVVRAHAPHFLNREMKVNLPELAQEHRLDLAILQDLWRDYRKRIKFVAAGGPSKRPGVLDPKDVPYLRLQKMLAYPIASEDPHLAAMGGRVVRIQIFNSLRAYSRNAAVEYQFKMSGAGSALMASILFETGMTLAQKASAIPKPLVWGGVIVAGLLMADPKSRKRILEIGAKLFEGGAIALEAAVTAIMPMIEEHNSAQTRAQLSLAQAQAALATGSVPVSFSASAAARPPSHADFWSRQTPQ